MASFPPLEWPIPSKSGQYQLFIQQQPRSHHRAHYETEGSRGAVKTPNRGHPEVQVLLFFISNAMLGVDHVFKVFGLPLLASWVPRHSSTVAPGLYRHSGREAPETTRLLPGPPHHREDCHHAQHGEDGERDQSAGDPSGAKEQHESGVSSTRRLEDNSPTESSQLKLFLTWSPLLPCIPQD